MTTTIKAPNHDGNCQLFLGVYDYNSYPEDLEIVREKFAIAPFTYLKAGDDRIHEGMLKTEGYQVRFRCLHCDDTYSFTSYWNPHPHTCYKDDTDCTKGCELPGVYHRLVTNDQVLRATGTTERKNRKHPKCFHCPHSLASHYTDQGAARCKVCEDTVCLIVGKRPTQRTGVHAS